MGFWSRIVCPQCGLVMMHCQCGMTWKLRYLAAMQRPLDAKAQEVLYTNLWELYDEEG